jgi:hypothetical protein
MDKKQGVRLYGNLHPRHIGRLRWRVMGLVWLLLGCTLGRGIAIVGADAFKRKLPLLSGLQRLRNWQPLLLPPLLLLQML